MKNRDIPRELSSFSPADRGRETAKLKAVHLQRTFRRSNELVAGG
jgi:hypothetical protein